MVDGLDFIKSYFEDEPAFPNLQAVYFLGYQSNHRTEILSLFTNRHLRSFHHVIDNNARDDKTGGNELAVQVANGSPGLDELECLSYSIGTPGLARLASLPSLPPSL